ncbi:hypothetical protein [Halobaculum limi]|uniref:hypothetical protein n=1 Tax=Halobaculum limi TaxID=3031916 RepID=UPI0024055254|nr:hypothetical protein [Halobaculum sp. YSMS11]
MPSRRPIVALSLAFLLVLAGCGGPPDTTARWSKSPDGDPNRTYTEDLDRIEVTGGNLTVDPNPVWEDLLAVRGIEADPPLSVDVDSPREGLDRDDPPAPGFRRALGVDAVNGSPSYLGYVEDPFTVHLSYQTATGDPVVAEYVLVHEYVHITQFRVDAYEAVYDVVPATHDGVTAGRSVTEGAAEFVASRYADRHLPSSLPPSVGRNTSQWRTRYVNASGANRLSLMKYYFGFRYVERRIDDPENLSAVYRSPPRTTEELIHANATDARYPPTLTLDHRPGEDGEWNQTAERTRMGELFVRGVLGTELPESQAAAGADGWGNDKRVALSNGDDRGYVWALAFDDPANATEFTTAFEAYLTASDGGPREANGVRFRIERPRDDLVVLVFGDESFREAATVDAPQDGYVTVET